MNKRLALTLMALASILAPAAPAQKGEEEVDRVLGLVHYLLEREHISGRKVDDEVSSLAIDNFLEALDPMKLYLEQEDVDALNRFRDKLDDMVKRGDLRFARLVFERFMVRLELRVKQVERLLKLDHDFAADEFFVTKPEATTWAKSAAEIADRWRRRIKYDLLRQKVDKVETEEAKEQILKRYKNFLRRMKQFDDEEILASFLAAITAAYDPHTRYIGAKRFEDLQIHMRLNYQGIGAHLQDQDGQVVITDIIPGGAAAKYKGLKDGDRILAVGQGEEGEMVDIAGMKLSDVVLLIRGKGGTVVRLKIRPKGGGDVTIHRLVRSRVELQDESALGQVLEVDGAKVGVIDLPSFYRDTQAEMAGKSDFRSSTGDVAKLLEDFKKQDVEAVVLDLRYNGGGLLLEAIELTGLFIDKGPVVQIKDGNDRVTQRDDEVPGMAWNGPLVVLTSRYSASASEILAGAIQDYDRGIVVGDPSTHGKGTVQHVIDLGRIVRNKDGAPKLGGLKLTLQKFYRASGDSTQRKGVSPDITLPALTGLTDGEADLPQALEFDRISPLQFQKHGQTGKDVIDQVRKASTKRVSESEAFAKIKRDMERFKALRELSAIPLEEKAYLLLMEDQEESDKAAEEAQAPTNNKREIRRDEYLDEVLRIARDYANVIKTKV